VAARLLEVAVARPLEVELGEPQLGDRRLVRQREERLELRDRVVDPHLRAVEIGEPQMELAVPRRERDRLLPLRDRLGVAAHEAERGRELRPPRDDARALLDQRREPRDGVAVLLQPRGARGRRGRRLATHVRIGGERGSRRGEQRREELLRLVGMAGEVGRAREQERRLAPLRVARQHVARVGGREREAVAHAGGRRRQVDARAAEAELGVVGRRRRPAHDDGVGLGARGGAAREEQVGCPLPRRQRSQLRGRLVLAPEREQAARAQLDRVGAARRERGRVLAGGVELRGVLRQQRERDDDERRERGHASLAASLATSLPWPPSSPRSCASLRSSRRTRAFADASR
jgi:hypothetical protein